MAFDRDTWIRLPAWRRFEDYDPYLTYSNPGGDCFIDPTGKPGGELDFGTEELFRIGKEAFERLTKSGLCSREDFNEGYAAYWACLDEFREVICEKLTQGKLVPQNDKGQSLSIDVKKIDDNQVVSVCWQMYSAPWNKARKEDDVRVYRELFLFHVLRKVDKALIGLKHDGPEAMVSAIEAANALSNAVAMESDDQYLVDARKRLGYQAAIEKLKRDPKQRDKAFVRDCWEAWQKNPRNYKGKAAFARDMLSKCEHLESTKKIEDWCRLWEVETKE